MEMELERKIIAGILICGVVVAFIVISLLVILTGRNPYFVKKKLAVGALLLSLSAIMSGCKGPGPGGVVTCYVMPLEERVTIDEVSTGQIVLDRNKTDTLHGIITDRVSCNYSIMILDSVNTVVKKETVYSDTTCDFGDMIRFTIACDNGISQGTYSLRLFNQIADSVKSVDDYRYIYTLKIVN
jgi:hypothetical protein